MLSPNGAAMLPRGWAVPWMDYPLALVRSTRCQTYDSACATLLATDMHTAAVAKLAQSPSLYAQDWSFEKDSADPAQDVQCIFSLAKQVDSVEDITAQQLRGIAEGGEVAAAVAADLKKRKLVVPESWKTYRVTRGVKFALERRRPPTDLTAEMMQK